MGPLISVAELAAELGGGAPPALLDVRWSLTGPPGLDEFRRGHIPGAVFVDLDTELSAEPGDGRGRHPLPEVRVFEQAMRSAGVRNGHPVVVYDAGGGQSAARAWWLLRHHGHGGVRLLDGGFGAWVEEGRPVEKERGGGAAGAAGAAGAGGRQVPPGDFTAAPGAMPVLDTPGAAALARSGILLDARAGERYRGEVEPVDPAAGHIPGALSAPTSANLGRDGRFLSPPELRMRFAPLGVRAPGRGAATGSEPPPVGVYCGSGVTAAHEILALELIGVRAALYPGSWSEWVSHPARPVATGPDPG